MIKDFILKLTLKKDLIQTLLKATSHHRWHENFGETLFNDNLLELLDERKHFGCQLYGKWFSRPAPKAEHKFVQQIL